MAMHITFYQCMWYRPDGSARFRHTNWMNRIPECEPAFHHDPGTYICNRFTLRHIIFDKDFHMDTAIEEIAIDESDYTAKPHSCFYSYLPLLNITDFQNRYSFPTPIYAYPLGAYAYRKRAPQTSYFDASFGTSRRGTSGHTDFRPQHSETAAIN
uniref:Uncharacterized protein n=1 Tax=Romanomermis culicivorax TaxID=13658 RepID=A0A915I4Y4_ROMCU